MNPAYSSYKFGNARDVSRKKLTIETEPLRRKLDKSLTMMYIKNQGFSGLVGNMMVASV
jgi:hypothetical protein